MSSQPDRTIRSMPTLRPRESPAMHAYSLTHLADSTLIHQMASLAAQDCATTAELLAHIMEFDARRLYLPAGYPSTFAYCVEKLHLSEDATAKRIHAGRAARRFPVLFELLASGELNLTALNLLAPHLRSDNARELIQAATHRCNREIIEMLARRFPKPDLPE